jgi:D-alanyl-D-alanine carboxypeptidase
VDAKTGKILSKKNATKQCHPASLTKKMTLYLLFDAIRKGRIALATKFRVSERASKQLPSKLCLTPGAFVSVGQIIEALIVKSANDIAVVAAEGLSGSEEAFVKKMNNAARALKMYDTHFENASGLPNKKQLTTVKDMARLAIALSRTPYFNVFALKTFKHQERTYYTHNHLLNLFQGTNGIKTGYVDASGYNISASIVRYDEAHQPVHLVCVVIGRNSPVERDQEVIDLVEPIFMKQRAFFYRAPRVGERTQLLRASVRSKNGTKLLLEQYEQRYRMSEYLKQIS